jgi:hypothetical protein
LPHSVTVGSRGYKRHCPGNQQSERRFVHGPCPLRVYTLFVENGAGIDTFETFGLESVYGEGPNAVRALGDVHLRPAAKADRAVFLSDGRVVDEARDPDQEKILERIKTLESDG